MEIIKEQVYQTIKEEMNKTNDYFTLEEIKKMVNITKISGEI